jgi:pyrroloquinoline quinone (PQQ) biosynthesis protein C
LFYAYADTLLALGRKDEALQWFLHSAAADVEDVTDAEDRVDELVPREDA